MSIDSAACEAAGEHQITARHPKSECPLHKVYPLPDFQKDVTGEYSGNPYPEQAEYRIHIVQVTPGDRFLLMVETADGFKAGEQVITDEEADGIFKISETDHDISVYEDDWKFPAGMIRTVEWTLQTDIDHTVRLDQSGIDEVAAWLRFALGFETYEGGPEWEY